jgi:hypothetical protein
MCREEYILSFYLGKSPSKDIYDEIKMRYDTTLLLFENDYYKYNEYICRPIHPALLKCIYIHIHDTGWSIIIYNRAIIYI